MTQAIQATDNFKDNLAQLPAIDGLQRIELWGQASAPVAVIENLDGKRGSLAVYQYLAKLFPSLNAEAADHGLAIFAEHVADARQRPGAHPNVDLLIAVSEGSESLEIRLIAAA